jgi:Coenzyme PQQ synthesis protein D (PqqD)
MRLSHNIRAVTNSGGGALLDLRAGKMFRLNTTGASIIELLTKGYAEDRIATEISERCGVDSALVCSDVHAFLASLKEHGLVRDGDRR